MGLTSGVVDRLEVPAGLRDLYEAGPQPGPALVAVECPVCSAAMHVTQAEAAQPIQPCSTACEERRDAQDADARELEELHRSVLDGLAEPVRCATCWGDTYLWEEAPAPYHGRWRAPCPACQGGGL